MSEEKNINLGKPGMLDKKWGSGERGKRRGQGVVRATIGLSHGSQSFKKEGVIRCKVMLILGLYVYCLLLPLGFKLHEDTWDRYFYYFIGHVVETQYLWTVFNFCPTREFFFSFQNLSSNSWKKKLLEVTFTVTLVAPKYFCHVSISYNLQDYINSGSINRTFSPGRKTSSDLSWDI